MASPSAAPAIGRTRFDRHTTPGGRTIMMMTYLSMAMAMNVNTLALIIHGDVNMLNLQKVRPNGHSLDNMYSELKAVLNIDINASATARFTRK